MKATVGEYLNLWTEAGHEDETDLDVGIDIFIIFAEWVIVGFDDMETRARSAIKKWKKDFKGDQCVEIGVEIALEEEFGDEAIMVEVRRLK